MSDQKFVSFKFTCINCSKQLELTVTHMDPLLFTKEGVTRITWCNECHTQLALLYRFTTDDVEFVRYLTTEDVRPERPIETGITVRPKASKQHH